MLGFLIFRITVRSFKTSYLEKGIKIGMEGSVKTLLNKAKEGKPFKLTRNQEVIWLKQVKKYEPISNRVKRSRG